MTPMANLKGHFPSTSSRQALALEVQNIDYRERQICWVASWERIDRQVGKADGERHLFRQSPPGVLDTH